MSFDIDAVREWGNWEDGPVEFTPSQRRLWRQLVSDVLAACDEIERLERLLELAAEAEYERLAALGHNIQEPPSGMAVAYGLCALSGALVATLLTSLAWWLL